jgi:hypothetical protein
MCLVVRIGNLSTGNNPGNMVLAYPTSLFEVASAPSSSAQTADIRQGQFLYSRLMILIGAAGEKMLTLDGEKRNPRHRTRPSFYSLPPGSDKLITGIKSLDFESSTLVICGSERIS